VTAVYDAWCGLVLEHRALIDRVAARHGITGERLLKSSLLTVALHDVGKLTANFGRMMRAVDKAELQQARKLNYRHEVAGLWVASEAARALAATDGPLPGGGLLETLAVAGHHRFLADDYLFDPGGFLNPLEWEPDPVTAVESTLALAKEMFRDQGWKLRVFSHDPRIVRGMLSNDGEDQNHPHDHLVKTCERILAESGAQRGRSVTFRELFILLKGLLMSADWMASGHQDLDSAIDASRSFVHVDPDCLLLHMKAKIESERSRRGDPTPFQGYRPFQDACGRAEGHVLAVAPTGSGKTEAACLWALRQARAGRVRKIFFLLPTMVTANSLHQRLEAFFRPHNHEVALVHSTADLVRERPDPIAEDEADDADVRFSGLSESHFFPPVIVGTVDQLLVTLFHAGRWAMKSLAAADAAIVIDEVHAYEPHTTGLIACLIEEFRTLGTRFMIMSATMPQDLQATIRRALGGVDGATTSDDPPVSLVIDEELHSQARNDWSTCDATLSSWLLDRVGDGGARPSEGFLKLWDLLNDRGQPIRILIVTNTVKRCQEIAAALAELGHKPVCYHSKFIFDHRRQKERHLLYDRPRLVVATQVVEVSLELDYDLMLTECAAFDALAQRAGRVNRFRRPTRGRIIVFRHDEESYNIYPRDVLDASWQLCRHHQGTLTERQLVELVERAYSGLSLAENPDFRDVQTITRNLQGRLAGVLDCPRPWESESLKSRIETYPQMSVIPDQFCDDVMGLRPWERRRYELKVPVWYAKKNLVPDGDSEGLPLCRMGYDADLGARLIPDKDYPEPSATII
jgi:CRISPR-associated endonuclease/helicase Cas3